MDLEVNEPTFLTAIGDRTRVEVFRSPLVPTDSDMYGPVREFIGQHGLVLAASETFEDEGWMFGKVEASVFVPPHVRNGVIAGTEISFPWLSADVERT